MDNIKRRSFLKAVFGVAVAPLLLLLAKLKPKDNLPRTSDCKNWENYTYSYDSNMQWPTEEELKAAFRAAHKNTEFQRPFKEPREIRYVDLGINYLCDYDHTTKKTTLRQISGPRTDAEVKQKLSEMGMKLAGKRKKAYQECIAIHEKMMFADTKNG